MIADAVTPNFLIQETGHAWLRRFGDSVVHDGSIADGDFGGPEAPGPGLTVKAQDLEGLPYEPRPCRQYPRADGS